MEKYVKGRHSDNRHQANTVAKEIVATSNAQAMDGWVRSRTRTQTGVEDETLATNEPMISYILVWLTILGPVVLNN